MWSNSSNLPVRIADTGLCLRPGDPLLPYGLKAITGLSELVITEGSKLDSLLDSSSFHDERGKV